jgi:hypothetical protein
VNHATDGDKEEDLDSPRGSLMIHRLEEENQIALSGPKRETYAGVLTIDGS